MYFFIFWFYFYLLNLFLNLYINYINYTYTIVIMDGFCIVNMELSM